MESEYDLKGFRILKIYSDLLEGKVLKKKEYAEYFGVHERSIQRDIKSLKDFFSEMKVKYGYINDIEYKRALGGYILKYHLSSFSPLPCIITLSKTKKYKKRRFYHYPLIIISLLFMLNIILFFLF